MNKTIWVIVISAITVLLIYLAGVWFDSLLTE